MDPADHLPPQDPPRLRRKKLRHPSRPPRRPPRKRHRESQQKFFNNANPAISLRKASKKSPLATCVYERTRKKVRSDEDAGQMSLRWVTVDSIGNRIHTASINHSHESSWKPKEVPLGNDCVLKPDVKNWLGTVGIKAMLMSAENL